MGLLSLSFNINERTLALADGGTLRRDSTRLGWRKAGIGEVTVVWWSMMLTQV
jgi:hypothetical protein